MTFEEKQMFWDRTNYAVKLMQDKDTEGAKFQILGFMADWLGFFGQLKEHIFTEIGKNPDILAQNKGFLPIISTKLAENPQFKDLKDRNDGLYQVSTQLWKTVDPNQDLTKFEAYLKENKNRIYGFTVTYSEVKDMVKSNRGSSDIKGIYQILKKYEEEILPKMKEFASVAPDPGTFIIYAVSRGIWDLLGVVDRLSLIPFYTSSVYQNVRKRELANMQKEVPDIEGNLNETSVTKLENIKTDIDLLLKIDETDQDVKKLAEHVAGIMVKAQVVYDKILEGRRMSSGQYKGNDNIELIKTFAESYKKAYPKETFRRVVLVGEDWIVKEDKIAEFREGAPGTVVGTQQTFRYKILETEVATNQPNDKKTANVYICWYRHDMDMTGKLIGKPYVYSSGYKFKMFDKNVEK